MGALLFVGGVVLGIVYIQTNRETDESVTQQPRSSFQEPRQISNEASSVIPGGEEIYKASFVSPQTSDYYIAMVNADSSTDDWSYVTSLQATAETGDLYDQGAFCRLFTRPDGIGYDVTYGGGFGNYVRSYNGVIHRLLGDTLAFSGSPEPFEGAGGGDIGIDTDGESYFLLLGHPKGWSLKKYDLDYQLVDETVIELPEKHANNDMTLRYVNGYLMAADLYDPTYEPGEPPDMRADTFLHVWVYTTDLTYVDDVVLDDTSITNGATIVYYEGTYAVVSADHFQDSNLIALLYDEDWNFLEKVDLQENAQWSMGGEYRDGFIYIAYHKGPHGHGDVYVDVYDPQWNLQETIEVTDVGEQTPERAVFAQHPWIEFDGDRMFVIYTLGEELLDEDSLDLTLTCMLSVYEGK